MSAGNKVYLGDGVYAAFDGWNIVLTTENGISTTNTIFIEPEVLRSFNKYVEEINETTR